MIDLIHRRGGRVVVAVVLCAAVPSLFGLPATARAEGSGATVVGEVVQTWSEYEHPADAVAHADDALVTWIRTESGDAVRVSTDDLADQLDQKPGAPEIPVGAKVAVVVGNEVPDATTGPQELQPALEVLDATVVAAATPAPSAAVGPVTDTVTVVRVVPAGGVEDLTTQDDVIRAVNTEAQPFWDEQSDGRIVIEAAPSSTGWVHTSAGCTDPYGMWDEAAAVVGFTPGPGKHLLLYIPNDQAALSQCAYGLAEVKSGVNSGGRLYVRGLITSVISHEFGHNFGLNHASALQCYPAVEQGTCRTSPYDDWYDVMGVSWSQVGTLGAPHAALLGLLPTAAQAVLTANGGTGGSYRLLPMGGRSGLRALKLVVPAGLTPWLPGGGTYWLEYRAPVGRDAWLGTADNTAGLQSGVLLRRSGSGNDTSLLLDGTPSSSAYDTSRQVTLPLGQAVGVGGTAFTVVVEDVSASGATVRVGLRGPWLEPSEELGSNQILASPDGRYQLVMSPDGTLSVNALGRRVLWRAPAIAPGARLVMQPDGNLVAYSPWGSVLWHAGTWGNPGARAVLQDDGNLVVYRSDGVALWWSGMDIPDQLRDGQFLVDDQSLVSRDGRYRAVAQADGNIVVYGPSDRVIWASFRFAAHGRLVLQGDGQLVSYSSTGGPIWYSGTYGNPGAFVALQDDGNLVVYRRNGSAAWWSGADRTP